MIPFVRHGRIAAVVALTTAALVTTLVAGQLPPPAPPPLPLGPGQTGPPLAEGTGAISGVLTDASTGRPLGGAVVTLSGRASGAGGFASLRQTTDEKGRFIFTRLPSSGGYIVSAAKIGFFEPRNTRSIALADGQWFADAKISMWKLGGIGGIVTDEANEPVVGVFVRVLAQVLVSGLPQLAAGPVTRTDDRGVYRIAALQPGKYLVVVPSVQSSVPADTTPMVLGGYTPEMAAQAEAAGRGLPPRTDRTTSPDGRNLLFMGPYPTPAPDAARSMAYPITFYPSARSPREAAVVELHNGEDRGGIDLQIRPVPVVRVSGIVDGPPEAEAAGLTLRLLPAGSEGLGNGSEVATALVAANGSFAFLNVPAGDYTLVANRAQLEYQVRANAAVMSPPLPLPPATPLSSSGSGPVASGSSGTDYSYRNNRGAVTYAGKLNLTIGARDVTDVVVSMKRGVSISGKVVNETEAAPPNRAATSLPVYAEPADGNVALGMPTGRMNPNDPQQTFTIDGLLPGLYRLRFLGNRNAIKSIVVDGKDYTNAPLDTTAGRDLAGIVVTFTDKVGKIGGYARDAQNQIATHGSVLCFPIEPDQWTGYGFSPRRIQSTAIGTNGSYSFGTVPAGTYLVIGVDDALASAWQDPKFLAAAARLATTVTVDWGETKTTDVTIHDVPGFRGSAGG